MKRTIKSQTYYLMTIGVILVSLVSCKPEIESKLVPVLSTETISSITQNTAVCGGNITSDNGLEVTARGVCWNLKPNPTINDSLTKDAAGTGKFVSNLNNLLPDTTYYVRAYATNSDGTAYGLQVTFRTLKGITPLISTTKAINLTDISATSGGNITFNGGTIISERGVCWSTNPLPTIASNKTSDGNGSGVFTSTITGLTEGTTYYIRAFAVNNTGVGYGNQDTIKTLTKPTLNTSAIKSITKTSAISGGNIDFDGGSPITSRGIVWGTSPNPTISLSTKTTDGTGIGTFTSNISGLTENITYYVRAYATNIIGTSYGQQLSFETTSNGTFTDSRDGNSYRWIRIGDQVWMAENLKATKYNDNIDIPNVTVGTSWVNLTTGAYCWYNNNVSNSTYGALYNWFAVNTGKLAPIGWHVPSESEWAELESYITTNSISLINTSGFNALKAGWRDLNGGAFFDLGTYGYWWTSTETESTKAWIKYISTGNVSKISHYTSNGVSVRCIKD